MHLHASQRSLICSQGAATIDDVDDEDDDDSCPSIASQDTDSDDSEADAGPPPARRVQSNARAPVRAQTAKKARGRPKKKSEPFIWDEDMEEWVAQPGGVFAHAASGGGEGGGGAAAACSSVGTEFGGGRGGGGGGGGAASSPAEVEGDEIGGGGGGGGTDLCPSRVRRAMTAVGSLAHGAAALQARDGAEVVLGIQRVEDEAALQCNARAPLVVVTGTGSSGKISSGKQPPYLARPGLI